MTNADWDKYSEMLNGQMGVGMDKRGRTLDEWERDTKKAMLHEADRTTAMKKVKVGKTRLKGWWDGDGEIAIRDRKRTNKTQRCWRQLMEQYGERFRQEWEIAWKRCMDAKKTAAIIISKKIGKWEEGQAQNLNRLPRRE